MDFNNVMFVCVCVCWSDGIIECADKEPTHRSHKQQLQVRGRMVQYVSRQWNRSVCGEKQNKQIVRRLESGELGKEDVANFSGRGKLWRLRIGRSIISQSNERKKPNRDKEEKIIKWNKERNKGGSREGRKRQKRQQRISKCGQNWNKKQMKFVSKIIVESFFSTKKTKFQN